MLATEPAILPFTKKRRPLVEPARLWLACRRLAHQAHLLRHWWLTEHKPFEAVFVLASARSGSNLLVDYLNRLPGVQSQSEVLNWRLQFGPRRRLHYSDAVRHIRRSLQSLQTEVRGCKLFLSDLEHYRLRLDDLEDAFPTVKYIVLYRRSLAEQFVSLEVAQATQQWVLLAGQDRKHVSVHVDPTRLRNYCEGMRAGYESMLAHPAVRERGIVLSYEELAEDPFGCLRRQICPLLGVPAIEPKTILCKQNPQPLADRVANYSEVAALLASPLCHQHYAMSARRCDRRLAA